MTAAFDNVAHLLMREHADGARYHLLPPETGVTNLDAAYAVQRRYVELMIPKAGRPAGYKIGLTSARMQKMCNIDRPLAGVVLASRVMQSGAVLHTGSYGRMGLEFEVGVRLGRDLPPRATPYNLDEVALAVDGVCAGVEVVDDRNADYKVLEALSLIADNAWNAGIVLGDFTKSWSDLESACGVMKFNGEKADRGFGRDVLGHPFIPLTWLANHLAASGNGLKAGDIVMTGSLIPTRFPKEPGQFRFDLSGVGSVELSVAV
ncbi:MAG: 2-keto-4-pentenoate hydratase [Dongiaceae bacterium]